MERAKSEANDVPAGGWILPAVASVILALLWTPFLIMILYGIMVGG